MLILFTTQDDTTYMNIFIEEDVKDIVLKGLNKSSEHSEIAKLLKERFQEFKPSGPDDTEEMKSFAYKTFLKGEQECSEIFNEYVMLLAWYGIELSKTEFLAKIEGQNDDLLDLFKRYGETFTEHLREEIDALETIGRLIQNLGPQSAMEWIVRYKEKITDFLSKREKGYPTSVPKVLS